MRDGLFSGGVMFRHAPPFPYGGRRSHMKRPLSKEGPVDADVIFAKKTRSGEFHGTVSFLVFREKNFSGALVRD